MVGAIPTSSSPGSPSECADRCLTNVVLEIWPHEHGRRYWLVLQDGVAPYGA